MAVDEKLVESHIADYQDRYTTSDELARNRLAFRAIKEFRNGAGDSADESLAAAEHYLFARHMVSNGVASRAQMVLLVLGYDSIKYIAQLNSRTEMAMRHNPDRPTSKVSTASIAWGLKGADDGEADRKRLNAEAEVPIWNWDAMKFGGKTDMIAELGKKAY